jgi:hypothetical protein
MRTTAKELATKERTQDLALQKAEEQLEILRNTLVLLQLRVTGLSSQSGSA